MKTKKYIIRNYKGNLLESVKKFQASHEGIKIFEATEKNNNLKIIAEAPADETPITEGANLNKARKLLAAGGNKLKSALEKLSDLLGSYGDIKGALNDDDVSEEEYELITDFFNEVYPKATKYTWKPYDSGWSDQDQEQLEALFDLCQSSDTKGKFLFIFKWNNNYEWGEGSVYENDLESAKAAFAKEMEHDSYEEFDDEYHVNEILQIPTQSVKKIM